MKKRLIATAFTTALLILGCETTSTNESGEKPLKGIAALKDDARLGEKVDRICFASQIDGFRATTKNTLIVESGLRKEFIMETFGGCSNLRGAQAVSLPTGFSCLSDRDSIIVHDSVFGTETTPFSNQRCSIKSIHRWNENADEVDMDGLTGADVEPIMEPLK